MVVLYFDKHTIPTYISMYCYICSYFFRTCIFLNFCEVLLTQIWKTRKSIYYVFIAGLQKVYCTLLFQLWQKLHPSKEYKWKPEFFGCFFGFFSRFFSCFFFFGFNKRAGLNKRAGWNFLKKLISEQGLIRASRVEKPQKIN